MKEEVKKHQKKIKKAQSRVESNFEYISAKNSKNTVVKKEE